MADEKRENLWDKQQAVADSLKFEYRRKMKKKK